MQAARPTHAASVARTQSPSRTTLDRLYDLIAGRKLAPGQQIHQEAVAQQLGVSRIPVREALKALAADGVVTHYPNRGFFVRSLSASELRQVYLMRQLLETEILRRLPPASPAMVRRLRQINASLASATSERSMSQMVRLNREFHHAIFEMSDLSLLVKEAERLWLISEPYRALYLWDESARRRVIREHAEMISHIRAGERDALVSAASEHRKTAETKLLDWLEESRA